MGVPVLLLLAMVGLAINDGMQDAHPDQIFIQQVFYGCVRYKKVVKVGCYLTFPFFFSHWDSHLNSVERVGGMRGNLSRHTTSKCMGGRMPVF